MKRDLEFLYEVGSLRFLERKWRQFLGPNFQNITEHTFRVIWIALILARHEKVTRLDTVIKMAIVHDLAESRTGDADYVGRQYNERNESLAIADMLADTVLENELIPLIEEYEVRKSIEAKIVKDADNLDVDLELQEQEAQGHTLKKVWTKIRKEAVGSKLFTKSARKLWTEIQKSNPHDWHLHARNRYNSGDWKGKNKSFSSSAKNTKNHEK